MKQLVVILLTLLCSDFIGAQDTINQKDDAGLKQGHWIYFGKDRPESGIPPDGKVEEGNYVNDRKESTWIKYHDDGKTPKIKAEYVNNRPCGNYIKYDKFGQIKDSGDFQKNTFHDSLIRGRGYIETEYSRSTRNSDSITGTEKSDGDMPLPKTPNPPNTKGIPFNENGYNKVYNEEGEVWIDGVFKNVELYDGKVYQYDRDGILFRVRIYKSGLYHSDGQL